jgi:predicted lactoylglutathione lyase
METVKISDTAVEITTTVTTAPVVTKQIYERKFIEEQIIAITAQRNALIAAKEAELKECTDILAEMDKLGVVSVKPVEPKEGI